MTFTQDNCRGYTDEELTALNAEWAQVVADEQLDPNTDDYHAREKQFQDAVARR